MRTWQNIQIATRYTDGYLHRMHGAISTLFNYAVRYYNLPSNPCRKAECMGKYIHSIQFWTLDQYNSFIQHIEHIRAKTALELLFYSGMRLGEMLALTLGNLDFTDNTISITTTYVRKTKTPGPPKTDNGIRCISMPATVMQDIQTYTSKIYDIKPSDRLFTFTESLIRRNIGRGAEKAGIPRIRIHDIRHPYVKPTTQNISL